jgi:dihydroorotate dehydrogenase electron transfer subunit
MPADVSAAVIANTPLSSDYNVLALAAPAIAAAASPGQFVMVKAASGHDPLLRRPFSVFEVLRDRDGRPTGITLLNKRIGASTRLLSVARPGDHVACLGPLGRRWELPATGSPAYMVAGGVGLAAFATLAESLAEARVPRVLFYGARSGAELFYLDFFKALDVELVLTTEDGSVGERGRITAPLDRRLASTSGPTPVVYACGPEGMMAATSKVARQHQAPCFVSLERIMGCGLGGCYSCVVPVRADNGHVHHMRSCLAGPVMAAENIVWD